MCGGTRALTTSYFPPLALTQGLWWDQHHLFEQFRTKRELKLQILLQGFMESIIFHYMYHDFRNQEGVCLVLCLEILGSHGVHWMRISQICILTRYSDTIVLKRNDYSCSKKHSWILISSLMALVGLGKCDRLLLFSPLAFWPLYLLLPGRKRCCHPHQHPPVPVQKYLSFF